MTKPGYFYYLPWLEEISLILTTGNFTLNYQLNTTGKLIVTDLMGRLCLLKNLDSSAMSYNGSLTGFEQGIYYYKLTDEFGEVVSVGKIILAH